MTSPVFTFIIGLDRIPIVLHNALVAQHSSTLNALMNGAMAEAKSGRAGILEVDVETFVHFSQWLYTGRYDMPYSETSSQEISATEYEPEKELRPWDHGLDSADKKRTERFLRLAGAWETRTTQAKIDEIKAKSGSLSEIAVSGRKQSLWKGFVRSSDAVLSPPPRKNAKDANVQWADILLGHARLYCFADMYGILSLQKLCLNAVRAALTDLDCEGDQVDALVQLISYTMSNTPAIDAPDPQTLRAIVLDFAVVVLEILVDDPYFNELLWANNDLSVSLLRKLGKRLD